jgi:hypothetical protein
MLMLECEKLREVGKMSARQISFIDSRGRGRGEGGLEQFEAVFVNSTECIVLLQWVHQASYFRAD